MNLTDRHSLRAPIPLLLLLASLVALGLLLAACSDGDDADVPDGAPPPTNVPTEARPVETVEFGVEASAETTSEGAIASMQCADEILLIATEQHAVHAELPCDRMPPQEVVDEYLGANARITLIPADPSLGCEPNEQCGKLFVKSDTAGSLEFTVGHAWLLDR